MFFRHPSWLFAIQRRALQLVWRVLDLDAASWVVRRPEWLRAACPSMRLSDGITTTPLDEPTALRIRHAYRGALTAETDIGDGIWSSLRGTLLSDWRRALLDDRPDMLRKLAGELFRTSAVNGFSYGSTFDRWPHRWRYLPIQIELSAVTLAECLGIIRLENPEQGTIGGWRRHVTPHQLIERLEARLGLRIEHPRHGNPRGIEFGGRFLARETCSQLYTAHRILRHIDAAGLDGPIDVVEIGGGYGGLCFWLRQMLGERAGRYAIVDLPEVSAIQAVFLTQGAPSQVALPGEPAAEAAIQLVLNDHLDELAFGPTVAINQDSLPEMPPAVADGYLRWIARSGAALFVSINHEADALNACEGLQNWVSDMAAARPEFTRVSREKSWDRRGYVEEAYRLARA